MAKKKAKKKSLKKKDLKKKDKKKKVLKKEKPSKKDRRKKESKKKQEKKLKGKKVKSGKKPLEKPVTKTVASTPVKSEFSDHSSNYNVRDAVAKLRTLQDADHVKVFTKGEKRITVTKAIPPVLARL
jgi:hypothetical protein